HDDWKFLPLALMNRYQTDSVSRGKRARFVPHFGFFLLVDKAQKTKQPFALIRIESTHQIHQPPHIGYALRSALAREQQSFVVRLRQRCLQTIRQRRVADQLAPASESIQELVHFVESVLITRDASCGFPLRLRGREGQGEGVDTGLRRRTLNLEL